MTYKRILVISDLHFPFAHPDWFEFFTIFSIVAIEAWLASETFSIGVSTMQYSEP